MTERERIENELSQIFNMYKDEMVQHFVDISDGIRVNFHIQSASCHMYQDDAFTIKLRVFTLKTKSEIDDV